MESESTPTDTLTSREQEIIDRISAGLTDQQIANELFLSLNTVKWYNRQIYSKLGVSNRTQAIAHANQWRELSSNSSSTSPTQVLPNATNNLPARSSIFIGRSREIAEVVHLLEQSRLLTLTGTGGIGKTRLALQVVTQVASSFADGVCFVDLTPLTDASLVVSAIARALAIQENSTGATLDAIKHTLTKRQLLLLLDNFEQVIEAAPSIAELLAEASQLRILVTSREALRISNEQQYPVPGLSQSEAGTLFIQRARLSQPNFDGTGNNADAIAQMCARLDGLPLAIELAAARCNMLTVQALVERLICDDNATTLRTLSHGSRDAPLRHRSLYDMVAWSDALLNADEKRLFARLAVFRGSRSLEAIEAICAADLSMDILDALNSLVEKSLVQAKARRNGEPSFMLLEVIQAYAEARLQASEEADAIRQRHAEYFLCLAEQAQPHLTTSKMWKWLDILDDDFDNIRLAVKWCCVHNTGMGMRLVGAIQRFCVFRGHMREASAWLNDLLAQQTATQSERAIAAKAYGVLCYRLSDYVRASESLNESLQLFRQLEDRENVALTLSTLGVIASDQGHYSEAEALQRQSLDISRQDNFIWNIASCQNNLAISLRMQGKLDEALAAFTESADCYRQIDDESSATSAIGNMAGIYFDHGDYEKAQQLYENSYATMSARDDKWRLAYIVYGLAEVAAELRQYERSKERYRESLQLFSITKNDRNAAKSLWNLARLEWITGCCSIEKYVSVLGYVAMYMHSNQITLEPRDQTAFEQAVAQARSSANAEAVEAAWTVGQDMPQKNCFAWLDSFAVSQRDK